MTVAVAGAQLWTTARMSAMRAGIDVEVARLPAWAQRNSRVELRLPPLTGTRRPLAAAIALPIVCGLVGGAFVALWPTVA